MVVMGDGKEESLIERETLLRVWYQELEKLQYFLGIEIARSEIKLIINKKNNLDFLKEIKKKIRCRPVSRLKPITGWT